MVLRAESSRRVVVSVIIMLVFAAIIGKLFYIQVIDSSYKFSAANNVLRYIT
ncbi:MAG: hypothetical protein H5T24_11690, partial [Bacteroidales bacterium]|nr:hypothetical protein [Bacteroidales bacterium]